MTGMDKVVVGVDGSQEAQAALRWAAAEAQAHGATLTAVLAWSYLDQHHLSNGDFDPAYGEDEARAALHQMVAAADLPIEPEEQVVCDLPSRALLEAAADADLLVVGARGLGGFRGLLLGSVSQRVLEEATCPVAVIHRDDGRREGQPVVVGVDGSAIARTALRWAAARARAYRVPLRIVHAWSVPFVAVSATEATIVALEDAARATLAEAMADPALDGLTIEGLTPCSGASEALLAHAEQASCLVVGTRGHGRFARVLLGSTSRQLVAHARCPVVVVPPAT